MLRRRLTPFMIGLGVLSALGFAGIAIAVTVDVVVRNLDLARLSWLGELSEYLMMGATFLGAPWVLHSYGHVSVDILPRYVPVRTARRLAVLSNLLGLVICGLLLWRTALVLWTTMERGSLVFRNLVFPEWFLIVPLLVCLFFCTLEFLLRLIDGEQ